MSVLKNIIYLPGHEGAVFDLPYPEDRYVILTGFEPFGEWKRNPTQELALGFEGRELEGMAFRTHVLPVDLGGAESALAEIHGSIDDKCGALVHLGLHPYTDVYRLERVALNMLDFDIPDNKGNERREIPIIKGEKGAFFSAVSVRTLHEALKSRGFETKVSNSAGTYICNLVYFLSLRFAENGGGKTKVLFVHMPKEEEIPLGKQERFVHALVEEVLSGA